MLLSRESHNTLMEFLLVELNNTRSSWCWGIFGLYLFVCPPTGPGQNP